jgi:hypothetical protein
MPTILSEKIYPSDILKLEIGEQQLLSRDNITILSGAGVLLPGTVLGKISVGAVSQAAKAGGNTGNGVITLDPTTPVLANAMVGVYTARAIVAGTNSATFRVTGPRGLVLGDFAYSGAGAVGSFADQIKFTITDGSTDFIVGDGFDITIADGSFKWNPLTTTALDGSQNAAGVLLYSADATSADAKSVAATRNGSLADLKLIWPGGITAAQKNAAIAQLLALGLVIRTGV